MSIEMMGIILLIVLVVVGLIVFYSFRQYRKVGPNEVLIISGSKKYEINLPDGEKKEIGFYYRIGGGVFINPLTGSAETLSIEVVPVHGKLAEVLSNDGIPLNVDFSAQVKIDTREYPLYMAITNFLKRGSEGIREVSISVLEGKVRELTGHYTVEALYKNRTDFNQELIKNIQTDFENLGLLLLSFGLNDITDSQGYIDALSRPTVTKAKYEASVDQAEKDKAITIMAAAARKDGEIARLAADAEIARVNWENEALKAESQIKVNEKKARADMAYELERFKIQKDLKRQEFAVKQVEMEETTRLEEMNISKRQKELEANVIKPAEARKFQVLTEADAESYRLKTEFEGKMAARKSEIKLDAEKIALLGEAEAQALKQKAESYRQYNEAAMYQMILEKMPELARAVAEPLSKIDRITMIEQDGKLGTSKITGEITKILAQLPEVVESLTGADLKKFLKEKLGASTEE